MHYPSLLLSGILVGSGILLFSGCTTKPEPSAALSIYQDAAVTSYDGAVYILEKFGADNIIRIDAPSTAKELYVIESDFQSGLMERFNTVSKTFAPIQEADVAYQCHFGDNWNPQDIAFMSATRAYVAQANKPEITLFNPSNGTMTGHINIAAYTFMPDSNSSPFASDLVIVGSDLFVLLQRRNGYNPGTTSLVLKINSNTDSIIDTVALQYKNGFMMTHNDGVLYISNPGSSFVNGDGAIEALTLATNAITTVIDEKTLGGSPNQIVHKSGSRFYVQVYAGWQDVHVVEIDAATGSVVEKLSDIKDAFGGICYDATSGRLYVGEREEAGWGVKVFENNHLLGSAAKSGAGLPPSGLVIVR